MLFIPHICNRAYIGVAFSMIVICFYVSKCLHYPFIIVRVRDDAGSYQRNPISKGIKKSKGGITVLQE